MRVLYFIYDHVKNPWVGGGGAVRAQKIISKLAEKGYQITVVSGNFPGAKNLVNGNINYVFVGSKRSYKISVLSYALGAIRFLSKNWQYYDIIVEDFAPWNPIFSFIYKNEKKVVLQVHQKEKSNILKRYNILGIPFYLIEAFYPNFFRNIVYVSEVAKGEFGREGIIIPNGIEPNLINKDISIGSYVLFLGRIDFYHKGLDLLLKLKTDIPIVIAGKGKDEMKLKKLKIPKNIKYVGYVKGKEKEKLIEKAKFLVMPSRYEGFPLVAIEAAALGKPLLVSDIPQLKFVIDNKFGLSFQKDNPEELKEKMETLFRNNSLVKEMGVNGKLYASKFTWDKIAEKYIQFLEKEVK